MLFFSPGPSHISCINRWVVILSSPASVKPGNDVMCWHRITPNVLAENITGEWFPLQKGWSIEKKSRCGP